MKSTKPYIIAEMGVNFYDTAVEMGITPLEAAKLYIDEAAAAGIDCAKFQSYKAETIAAKESPSYWDLNENPVTSQFELFKGFDWFNREDYQELCDYTHKKGMDFTCTPFDYASADYLESMVDFYKIASADCTNLPFVKYIAAKGKPIMIAVGASYLSEIDEALRTLIDGGCEDITLMHCVLSYPAKAKDANLRVIETLKKAFPNVKIGYSDHVPPDATMQTLSTAYLLGAEVIEKHFTLDKTLKGNDHFHAGDPKDFRMAIANFRWIDQVLGSAEKTVLDCEQVPRKQARRSLVLTRKMHAGEVIRKEDLIPKRPGTGISPKYSDIVLGRTVKMDLDEDTILTWDMI